MSLVPRTARAASEVTCVGDSITFGAGTSDPTTRSYPAQLGGLLAALVAFLQRKLRPRK